METVCSIILKLFVVRHSHWGLMLAHSAREDALSLDALMCGLPRTVAILILDFIMLKVSEKDFPDFLTRHPSLWFH